MAPLQIVCQRRGEGFQPTPSHLFIPHPAVDTIHSRPLLLTHTESRPPQPPTPQHPPVEVIVSLRLLDLQVDPVNLLLVVLQLVHVVLLQPPAVADRLLLVLELVQLSLKTGQARLGSTVAGGGLGWGGGWTQQERQRREGWTRQERQRSKVSTFFVCAWPPALQGALPSPP